MPKYIIEREVPGAGKLSHEQLQNLSQKSCAAIEDLGPQIHWIQSYVTEDKIYCVFVAPDEDLVRDHARRCGIPADSVSAVLTVLDPATPE